MSGPRQRYRTALTPDMSAEAVLRIILNHLLDAMLKNLDGARAGHDIESLHDFRVALRRTRSALSQLKNCFPQDRQETFRVDFNWLGDVTGPTRDLDVFRAKFDRYLVNLPPVAAEELTPFRSYLEDCLDKEQERMNLNLDSTRFRELLKDWRSFLTEEPSWQPAGPEAGEDVVKVAGKRTGKAFRRFERAGKSLTKDSPDTDFHKLRILGKRLRYLLEFFEEVYPGDLVGRLVKAMKEVQDCLGDFQDMAVQRALIDRYVHEAPGTETPPATFAAVGMLSEELYHRQLSDREALPGLFAKFDEVFSATELYALLGRR